MKKLLALILVLVMSVFVFAACESSEEKAAADEEAIKTIAAECLAKFVALDEAALEYTVAEKGAEKSPDGSPFRLRSVRKASLRNSPQGCG